MFTVSSKAESYDVETKLSRISDMQLAAQILESMNIAATVNTLSSEAETCEVAKS
jgi:hypothetical protein